jgi:hypothetical protein
MIALEFPLLHQRETRESRVGSEVTMVKVDRLAEISLATVTSAPLGNCALLHTINEYLAHIPCSSSPNDLSLLNIA